MKLLFSTNHKAEPSTILNANQLKYLNNFKNISIDFFNTNYHNYDIVLFMGYDHEIERAKAINPKIKAGVIDPRPPSKKQPIGADFIIANGVEMKDWYYEYTQNIFISYIYPVLEKQLKEHINKEKIIIGYHGNKIHLHSMQPRITAAVEKLSKDYKIEFWMMYNIEKLGKFDTWVPKSKNFKIKHIQWAEDNYEKYISKVDIGIVPNLIPGKELTNIETNKFRLFSPKKNIHNYNEHTSDYMLRFKATSNPGRIFVFAQYGIPVVADMFPSALQSIEDGQTGFICYSTNAWYYSLKKLAESPQLRNHFSYSMQENFYKNYSIDIQSKKFINFLNKL